MNDTNGESGTSGAETVRRRYVLRTGAVLGITAIAGLNGAGTAAASEGDLAWEFESDESIPSSPTVVDGTVYVGGSEGTLYAVDAATGAREWAFTEPTDVLFSSPTVVDGIVYVGSQDGSLYAVNAGIEGSSDGSRVALGTLGHHDRWAGRAVETRTSGEEQDDAEDRDQDSSEGDDDGDSVGRTDDEDGVPGFGAGAALAGGAGYLLS